MLITAVRQGELDEQSIRPTKRQRSERSEREQRIMITLLIVGPVRLITHRESSFPIPASPDGAAQRAGGTPTQRIASPSAFASALPLSLRFRCLAMLSKLKGSVSAWFENNRQPRPDGQPPFLKPKSPFLFRVAHCATNHKMKCGAVVGRASWRSRSQRRRVVRSAFSLTRRTLRNK